MNNSSGGHPPISRFSQFLVNPALQQGTPSLVTCRYVQVRRYIFLNLSLPADYTPRFVMVFLGLI